MPPEKMKKDIRQHLCAARGITLNGVPARITGVNANYATVTQLEPEGLSAEWSWDAARRIVEDRGGAFNTRPRR